MHLPDGLSQGRKPVLVGGSLGEKGVDQIGTRADRGFDDPSKRTGREPLHPRIDRNDARKRMDFRIEVEDIDLWMVELLGETVPTHVSGDEDPRTRANPFLKEREASKPLEVYGCGPVGHHRLEEPPPVPQRNDRRACHGSLETCRMPDLQVLDRDELAAVLVGTGKEPEQVFDRHDPLPFEQHRDLRSDARNRAGGLREELRGVPPLEQGRDTSCNERKDLLERSIALEKRPRVGEPPASLRGDPEIVSLAQRPDEELPQVTNPLECRGTAAHQVEWTLENTHQISEA
jgi:hypothetical protein